MCGLPMAASWPGAAAVSWRVTSDCLAAELQGRDLTGLKQTATSPGSAATHADLLPALMRPVSTWKVEEVGEWFDKNTAGLSAEGLARYKELFAEKGIDGFMLSSVPTTPAPDLACWQQICPLHSN